MHEVSLVLALFDQADRAIGTHPASAVCQVRVRIGDRAGVDRELFQTAFEGCRAQRGYGRAVLEVEREAAEFRCTGCGQAIADDADLICPACDGRVRLVRGGELILERLELEVADV